MKRALVCLLLVAACGGGSTSAPSPSPTPEPTTAAPLTFPSPFDRSRFDLACDDVAIAQASAAGEATRQTSIEHAAEGFRKVSDPAVQALADQVEAGDLDGVMSACTANGYVYSP